jgi:hypothetical protein
MCYRAVWIALSTASRRPLYRPCRAPHGWLGRVRQDIGPTGLISPSGKPSDLQGGAIEVPLGFHGEAGLDLGLVGDALLEEHNCPQGEELGFVRSRVDVALCTRLIEDTLKKLKVGWINNPVVKVLA